MSYSFFLHIGPSFLKDRSQILENFSKEKTNSLETDFFQFLYQGNEILIQDKKHFYCAGKIDNLQKVAVLHTISPNQKDENILQDLLERDPTIVNQFKGCFAIFCFDTSKNEVSFTIGNTGLMQAYITSIDNEWYVFSELKLLRKTNLFERKMIPISTYQYNYTAPIEHDFCFLQNVKKVIPGYWYQVAIFNSKIGVSSSTLYPICSTHNSISYADAFDKLHQLLSENIKDQTKTDKLGVPLSGGVDSSLVAAMLTQTHEKINTYTIGTAFGNEYENANETAQLIKSHHEEIFINHYEYIEGFAQSVWLNEICDPMYAEGYVGFYYVFKKAQNESKQLFTGYGADLILGDFLNIEDKSNINTISEYWCKRAAWTGELSPYAAKKFDLDIHHPFWEIDLIQLSLSLPFTYKYRNDEVKAILRDIAEQKKYLTNKIAYRKKSAFTIGASLHIEFAHYLSIDKMDYKIKSYFLYLLYQELFVYDKTIQEIDLEILKTKAHQYGN